MADFTVFSFTIQYQSSSLSIQSVETGRFFTEHVTLGYDVTMLTWVPVRFDDNTINVTFHRNLRSLAATTVPANYVLVGPHTAPATVPINSVSFTPGTNLVSLNITGPLVNGYYTLTLANNTAQALTDDYFNTTVPQTFTYVGTLTGGGGGGGSSRLNGGLN